MDYSNITDYTRNADPGLVLGIKSSPILNQSVIKHDITFTVHQVIADATRTILIFSYELPDRMINDGHKDRDGNPDPFEDNSGRLYERFKIVGFSAYTSQRKHIDEQKVTGIAYFSPLYSEIERITVTAENLDGIINATWSVEVPIIFMEEIEGRDKITHKMLKAEKEGLVFTVVDLTLKLLIASNSAISST